MNGRKHILFVSLLLVFLVSACSGPATQITPTRVPTQSVEHVFTPSSDLPLTERDVPRVSLEEARAALEAGTAVLVDVRRSAAHEKSHVAGSIPIPLEEIERDLTSLTLDKDQWIITYCA